MGSTTIYFAKLNLVSSEVFQVINKEIRLDAILQKLLDELKSGISYQDLVPIPLTEEEVEQGLGTKFRTTDYGLEIRKKSANGVEGCIFKTSKLYYNRLKDDNSIESSAVDNTEVVNFYLDIFNEFVGFNTKQRFGYQQFASAFESLINQCLENANSTYRFSVSVYTHGLNLDEIKAELMRIPSVQKLMITVQPPNPDDELLGEIELSLNSKLKELEEAKASIISTTIEAKGKEALRIDSQLISKELALAEDVYGSLNIRKAVSKGYVKVRAETKHGITFSSNSNRPQTLIIEGEDDFVDKVKGFVAQILISKQ